jgi:hypothetical protein
MPIQKDWMLGGNLRPPVILMDNQGVICLYYSAGREFSTPEAAEMNIGLLPGTGIFEDLTRLGDTHKRFVLIGE